MNLYFIYHCAGYLRIEAFAGTVSDKLPLPVIDKLSVLCSPLAAEISQLVTRPFPYLANALPGVHLAFVDMSVTGRIPSAQLLSLTSQKQKVYRSYCKSA